MASDEKLLEQARAAGAELAAAERNVLLARANYHTAIRRLHLGGSSLREIAQALSLSHQRVQQVVSAAGGSWWQVWRRRTRKRDAVCSWCARPPREVAKLVAGPDVYICDACVEAAERAIAAPDGREGDLRRRSGVARSRCSFCRKRPTRNRPLVTGPANICGECMRICREILDGRAA
jgi:hypothetical protein